MAENTERRADYDPSIIRYSDEQWDERARLEERFKHAWNRRFSRPASAQENRVKEMHCFLASLVAQTVIEAIKAGTVSTVERVQDIIDTEFAED